MSCVLLSINGSFPQPMISLSDLLISDPRFSLTANKFFERFLTEKHPQQRRVLPFCIQARLRIGTDLFLAALRVASRKGRRQGNQQNQGHQKRNQTFYPILKCPSRVIILTDIKRSFSKRIHCQTIIHYSFYRTTFSKDSQ